MFHRSGRSTHTAYKETVVIKHKCKMLGAELARHTVGAFYV